MFDRARAVDGYELLYRARGDDAAHISDHDAATHRTVADALVELRLDDLVDGRRIYLHVTPRFVAAGWHHLLPPGRTILEVVDDTPSTAAWADLLSTVSAEGYHVAHGGYRFGGAHDAVLELVDVLKVDVAAATPEELEAGLPRLRDLPLMLLAEKVETHEQFELCRALGFDYFQGYFFEKPQLVEGRSPTANRAAVLQLVAALEDGDAHAAGLADIIQTDAALTFKLLRLVNSTHFALPRRVESVRDCVVLLGQRQIRQLAMLLAMASAEEKPEALTTSMLVRAKMCESLARRIDREEAAFTTGILSLVDAVVDQPLEEAMAQLPIAPEIAAAVIDGSGPLGRILRSVVDFEHGDLDAFSALGIHPEVVDEAYLGALAWAREMVVATRQPANA